MYNCMFVSALPDPTCNSEKSANSAILRTQPFLESSRNAPGEEHCVTTLKTAV